LVEECGFSPPFPLIPNRGKKGKINFRLIIKIRGEDNII